MDSTLWQAIDALPAEERIELVEAIRDGLVEEEQAPSLTEAQRRELDRRLDAMERGRARKLSWDEVRSRLREWRLRFAFVPRSSTTSRARRSGSGSVVFADRRATGA